jgi:predicted esterase
MWTKIARPNRRTQGRIRLGLGGLFSRRGMFSGRRAWAAAVIVAALSVVARGAAAKALAGATGTEWIPATSDAPGVLVYPPDGDRSRPHPVTVMLHGMCDVPENECPYFSGVATKTSWLVCPRATLSCAGGGAIWPASRRTELVEAAIARVAAEHPGEVDTERERTLIGFSLGAFVAMDLANRAPSRWSRVLLLAAKVTPEPRALGRGSSRFVFAAGDLDLSSAHMQRTARRLSADGIDATFLSLGRVGHRFADDMEGWLERAYALFD